MLQRDYLLEIISQFVEAVMRAMRLAVENSDPSACQEIEQQVGELLDLEPETALQLAPDSLVTMMVLSGMGSSVAHYVSYSLERLSTIYESMGETDKSGLRHLQAKAVGESFDCDPNVPPEEFAELDAELFSDK